MDIIKSIYKKYIKFILFVIVGIITILLTELINRRILFFENDYFMNQVSTVLSYLISIIIAYILTKVIVFRTHKDYKDTVEEISLFIGLRIVTFFLKYVFMGLSMNLFNNRISTIIASVLVLILDYTFAKKIVFKD